MKKTLISLTSIPERYVNLEKTVSTLLMQKDENIDIILFLGNNNIYNAKIAKELKIEYVEDVGSFTKIKYASQKKDYDYIITADDDVVYPKDWAKTLISAMVLDESKSYGYRGRSLQKNVKNYKQTQLFQCSNVKTKQKVSILTGTWGCIYNNAHFGVDFLTPPKLFDKIDDIWINGYLSNKGIDRYVIPFGGKIAPTPSSKIKSLWEINQNGINNNNGLKYFEKLH